MTENDLNQAGLTPNKPYEIKELTGSLFTGRVEKRVGPNGEYSVVNGNMKVNNVEYYINGYPKKTKSGEDMLSLTFKPKQTKPSSTNTSEPPF